MFAGKTSELLQHLNKHEVSGQAAALSPRAPLSPFRRLLGAAFWWRSQTETGAMQPPKS